MSRDSVYRDPFGPLEGVRLQSAKFGLTHATNRAVEGLGARISGNVLEVTKGFPDAPTSEDELRALRSIGLQLLRCYGLRMRQLQIARLDIFNRLVLARWGPWKRPSVSLPLSRHEDILGDVDNSDVARYGLCPLSLGGPRELNWQDVASDLPDTPEDREATE